jgi:flavin reductase (DIM6/NTAB) family NADH-FMN oxidoreductase RutF
LYFGTSVVLLSTENGDGSANLAPMSSAWALGQTLVLGLGSDGHTAHNLRTRADLVINVPGPRLWAAVERIAAVTGPDPVPEDKRPAHSHERDQFGRGRPDTGAVTARTPAATAGLY